MLLVVGLGNPGAQYARNRHNLGFMALDEIARTHGFPPWRARFSALCTEGSIETASGPRKALLLKPQTFYNEAGRAVAEAMRFYQLTPEALVVFHDELDLAPGKFRLKPGGGHAGNNGLRSIKAHVDGDFRRGRIGIGHPGDKNRVTGYVLSDIPKDEQAWTEDLLDAIARSFDLLISGDHDAFQTRVTHLAPAPSKDTDESKN